MKAAERSEEGPGCPRCQTSNKAARSFCRKCGLHLKAPKPIERKPLPATTRRSGMGIKRGRPPAAESVRHLSQRDRRAEVRRIVLARDKVCQGDAVLALTRIQHGGPLDVNEIIPRAQWAAGYLDPDNCVLLCRAHHDWVTAYAHGAHALGLRKWAHERPDHAGLTDAEVEEIRRLYAAGGRSQESIADDFDVSPSTVSHVILGKGRFAEGVMAR